MLHLIIAENNKIKKIESVIASTKYPQLVSYHKNKLIVAEGFTKKHAVKIQFDFLREQMQKAKIAFEDYYTQLDALLENISINVVNE
ncbi:hypothetical protein GCM10007352_28800 [Mucilaginibacter phyllosphaerae]|nr:hypothetical protein GCM10007352_28800 [Mucilaginibacter phyllosphaerae]